MNVEKRTPQLPPVETVITLTPEEVKQLENLLSRARHPELYPHLSEEDRVFGDRLYWDI